MGFWVGVSNRINWWSIAETTISEGVPFRLHKYMSRTIFEGILLSLHYIYIRYVEYCDGLFHMCQMKESQNLNMAE